MSQESKNRFEEVGESKGKSLLAELVLMLKENKKFWMIPIILILLGFGLLLILGGTAVAPFIYTLF